MNILAGGALYHKKPMPAADNGRQNDRHLAGARYEMDNQIVGELGVTDEIGDQAERPGRNHDRHNGQTIEAIGQVNRIGRADDHEGAPKMM
jgi:hypothetical protein